MGKLTADGLGLDLSHGRADQLYRWFLASLLFGRPVQQDVSAGTYRVLIRHGLTSPRAFSRFDREGLRAILDEGNYARIDYIMTDELHEVMGTVLDRFGSVSDMVKRAPSRQALKRILLDFRGVGPTTAGIFLGEVPDRVIGSRAPRRG